MPKVSKEYLQNKRNKIVDTAFKVCNSKPVYDVTMKDIIRESDISQGGMYRFFKDIDEIFIEMVNRCNHITDYKNKISELFDIVEEPDIKIIRICKYVGRYIDDIVAKYGKVAFELNMVYVNDWSRLQKVQDKLQENMLGMLTLKLHEYIDRQICSGYFVPIIPKENILALFNASVDGIVRDVTIHNSYQTKIVNLPEHQTTAKKLMETLAQALLLMLNKK